MNRADAYAVVSRELERWRRLGYTRLVDFVGRPPASKSVRVGDENIAIDICVRWADDKRKGVRVEATAGGPSCFRLERLEEAIVVMPGEST